MPVSGSLMSFAALLACDATIILYKGGEMPLEEFVQSPYQRDILTHIVIPKQSLPRSFVCMRKSATDISTLNLSVVQKKSTTNLLLEDVRRKPFVSTCL